MAKMFRLTIPASEKREVEMLMHAYFDSKEEAEKTLEGLKRGEFTLGEIDWEYEDVEVFDSWDLTERLSDAEIEEVKAENVRQEKCAVVTEPTENYDLADKLYDYADFVPQSDIGNDYRCAFFYETIAGFANGIGLDEDKDSDLVEFSKRVIDKYGRFEILLVL